MVLNVVKYGHPVLRKKGARIESVTSEIKHLIRDMFETMEAAHGVGLAAQQVGHALQLTVIDVRPSTERPSTLELDGKEADPNSFMPLVLINPEIKPIGDPIAGTEGCLSFPEIYTEIDRPGLVEVTATNEKGDRLHFRAGGLLGRAIQHEYDHLQGILFIDRMSKTAKAGFKEDLEALQTETKAELSQKHKPAKSKSSSK